MEIENKSEVGIASFKEEAKTNTTLRNIKNTLTETLKKKYGIKEEEIVFRLKGIAKTEKISGNYLIKKGYKLLSINAVNKQEAA